VIAKRVYFDGEVQGVGFRYTAVRIASTRGIAGYVKNLSDGRVEILAEGPEAEVDSFIEEVRREMGSYIREMNTDIVPVSGNYKRFVVRY
jgi:acylphosphatase